MRKQRLCDTCRDPLGDSDALTVTGRKTGRVWFVHRPSTPGRGMCFRYMDLSRSTTEIGGMVFDQEAQVTTWDLELARSMALDERACQAVGLNYRKVYPSRGGKRKGGRRRAQSV